MHYRALPPASSYNFRSAIASEVENGVTRSHGRMMNSVKGGNCVSKGASKNEIVQRSVRIGAVRRQKGVCERKTMCRQKILIITLRISRRLSMHRAIITSSE